jgi:uncharacterized membrane protein YhaH (DUF805 family)
MGVIGWYFLAWTRIFDISGRSRRKEFAYFFLSSVLIAFLLFVIGSLLSSDEAGTMT